MIYIKKNFKKKVNEFPLWLKVMEGRGGCQMYWAYLIAQCFYFE